MVEEQIAQAVEAWRQNGCDIPEADFRMMLQRVHPTTPDDALDAIVDDVLERVWTPTPVCLRGTLVDIVRTHRWALFLLADHRTMSVA